MKSDEIVFTPKYDSGYILLLKVAPVLALFAAFLGVWSWRKGPSSFLLFAFVPAAYGIWYQTYRRIRFGESIVVERPVFPRRKTIEYGSIEDVAPGILKTRQGNILIQYCQNAAEFDHAVKESRRRGYWSEAQIKGELPRQEWISARIMATAYPIAGVVAFFATRFEPFGIHLHWSIWAMASFFAIGLPMHWYLTRRAA
jgi:hypothetical protein